MFSRHFLICDDDLKRYPPIISNINVLLELNVKVFYIGHCSDSSLLKKLQKAGLVYLPIEVDKMETNPIRKYFRMVSHTYKVKSILKVEKWQLNIMIMKIRCMNHLLQLIGWELIIQGEMYLQECVMHLTFPSLLHLY